jgi:16S rRNA C1402 (ribose-2'-O) methylase RsmI
MVLTCDLTKVYEEVIRGKTSDITMRVRIGHILFKFLE